MNTIDIEQRDHVVRVILHRPEKHNALDAQMIHEITEAFKGIQEDPTLRAVFLKGKGDSFCAGADLHWMQDSVQFSEKQNLEDAQKLFEMFAAIRNCRVPVVAKLHGHVMGGALGIVAACDIVAAELSANFAFSEVRLGLVPAVISWFVQQKMQPHYLHEYLLTGKRFDAKAAKEVGLVNFVGRELEINNYLETTLDSFALLAPEAVVQTKKLLLDLPAVPDGKVRDFTASLIAKKRVGPEGQEGLKAFFEKRKPNWVMEKDE